LRIAQIAPLAVPVPPSEYGGTERVIYDLTEGLVARGHDVTLFASGDSETSGRLVPAVPQALWKEKDLTDPVAALFRMHADVFSRAAHFDLIHTHTDYFAFPYAKYSSVPVVTTLHGRLDIPDMAEMLRVLREPYLVSISRSQRSQVPDAHWAGTVHHGIVVENYRFDACGGEGLVFLGRFAPEKGAHLAIDVAIAAGVPLTLAGRIPPEEQSYFDREIRPRLAHRLISFVGEVGDEEKQKLLCNARALIFPIDWPEPFGLVMVEAMACGTPVIATPKGSAPEVIADGVTGILASSEQALVEAVAKVAAIDRMACRRHVEKQFAVARMVGRYERIYRQVLNGRMTARLGKTRAQAAGVWQGDSEFTPRPGAPSASRQDD
jgi:glycosyltransferase involved in cell wall biosynthesis